MAEHQKRSGRFSKEYVMMARTGAEATRPLPGKAIARMGFLEVLPTRFKHTQSR